MSVSAPQFYWIGFSGGEAQGICVLTSFLSNFDAHKYEDLIFTLCASDLQIYFSKNWVDSPTQVFSSTSHSACRSGGEGGDTNQTEESPDLLRTPLFFLLVAPSSSHHLCLVSSHLCQFFHFWSHIFKNFYIQNLSSGYFGRSKGPIWGILYRSSSYLSFLLHPYRLSPLLWALLVVVWLVSRVPILGRIHCWGKFFLGSCECAIPLFLLLLSFSATILARAV